MFRCINVNIEKLCRNVTLNHSFISPQLQTKKKKNIECKIHAFFISNHWLKLAKNQANAKQHPQAELLLFPDYPHSSSALSSKMIGHILQVCLYSQDYMINHNENEGENEK